MSIEPIARQRPGQHRIFLGYAVGVGKTFAMLTEAGRLAQRDRDVVVGVLESHGRADVLALARDLEQLAPLRVQYRGLTFEELDVDAAIERRPDWLVVDELAHQTAPGTPYAERWQAVNDIVAAGVNVLSTVNVQHVESLGDFVAQVTGTQVHEVVPDCVLEEADTVTLVDLPPDELIDRVKRGRVYQSGETGPALTHFFQRSVLEALRTEARRIAESHGARTA